VATCKECNKRFRIKLNSRFGIVLKDGYQTTCPYCGYVIYLDEISQVRRFLILARMLPVFVTFLIGMNARLLASQGLLTIAGVGAVVFVFATHHLTLWIAGKMYDKLSKCKTEDGCL